MAGAGLELVEARLELLCGAALGRGVALDLIEARAKHGELRLEIVLLVLQRVRGVNERRVVADGELAALGLGTPLERYQEAEKYRRNEQHERVLKPSLAGRRGGDHNA